MFFLWKNNVFSKQRLSKITSISASILVPTCLHVGLQNRRFFKIMAFQEAFKISSFFASIFLSILAPSWPPTWGHLGGQDGSKFEKMAPKIWDATPQEGSGYEPAFEDRSRASWPRFWGGSGLDFRRFLDDFWNFLAYFGHVFGFLKVSGLLWACLRPTPKTLGGGTPPRGASIKSASPPGSAC